MPANAGSSCELTPSGLEFCCLPLLSTGSGDFGGSGGGAGTVCEGTLGGRCDASGGQ